MPEIASAQIELQFLPVKRSHRFIDQTGKRYGRLVAVEMVLPYPPLGRWRCRCDCGKEVVVRQCSLVSGNTKSCGCFKKDRASEVRHGMCGTRTYHSWAGMITRCTNRKIKEFKHYGGRGITVCDRWLKFENFLADMGECPERMSIDRRDVNGNYEPENCAWKTMLEQAANKRNNRVITAQGVTLHLAEWSRRTGLGYTVILNRIRRGWSEERAVMTPAKKTI